MLHEDRFVPFLVLLGALGLVWLVAVLARADLGSDLALVTIFAVSVVVAWASFCRADFDRLAAGELLLFSSLLVVVWAVSAGGRGADARAPTGRGTWLLVALVVGQVVTGGVDLVRGGEAAAPGVQLALGCLGLLAVAFAQPRVALKPAVALLVSGLVLFFPAWSSRHDRRWLEASGPHELTFFPPQHVRFAPMSRCAGTLERGPVVIVAEDEVRLGSLLIQAPVVELRWRFMGLFPGRLA